MTADAGVLMSGRGTLTADVGAGSGVSGRILAVWGALFFNVLAVAQLPTVVPFPTTVGQLITQGCLLVALVLALMANPRAIVRPNLFLVLLTILAVVSLLTSIHGSFLLGSTFRVCRLIGFVVVLWLLTPWWGRRDMLLLRCHLRCLWVVLGTVLVGAALAPGKAFSFGGRLSGAIWPLAPTQVAHFAAIVLGVSAVLWMCRVMSGRQALLTLLVVVPVLIATHTRTAFVAMVAGLLVAGVSLFLGQARVRRTSALGGLAAVLAATLFAPELTSWLVRGQSAEQVMNLTGRTVVWSAIYSQPRATINQLFGSGLSNKSFNGLPVDSNWATTYLDQGWFGVSIAAAVLVLLLLMAATYRRGPQRAVALFITVYCIFSSFTETGLADASTYLLDLTVAASLLLPQARGSDR
jgi:hypothetical protein